MRGSRAGEKLTRMTSRIPTCLLLGIFAGWLNRHQQAIIEYLRSENEILKRQLNRRRPRLTDGERRLLAVKGKALGRKVLETVACIVTPDTIPAVAPPLVRCRSHQDRRGQSGGGGTFPVSLYSLSWAAATFDRAATILALRSAIFFFHAARSA